MKRWQIGMAVVMGFLFYSITQAQAQQVWVETSMAKILQTTQAPSPSSRSISLSAARNEFESFQIAVRHTAAYTVSDITVNNLQDGAGNTIGGRNIIIYREGYVTVAPNKPSGDPLYGKCCSSTIDGLLHPNGGKVPDALIPKVDDYFGETRNFSASIPANTTQAYWIEIYVPETQPAGTYTGSATINPGAAQVVIDISLRVRNITLPSTSSMKSAFGVNIGKLWVGHDGGMLDPNGTNPALDGDNRTLSLVKLYTLALLRHRISNSELIWPPPSSVTTPNWSVIDNNYGPFFNGSGTLTFHDKTGTVQLPPEKNITLGNGKLPGAKLTTIRLNEHKNFEPPNGTSQYYDMWAKHFQSNAWFEWPISATGPAGPTRLFEYICDEPKEVPASSTTACTFEDVIAWEPPVHATTPRNRILLTTDIQKANRNSVTTKVDLLVPPFRYMHDKPGQTPDRNSSQRNLYPTETWWYQGCGSHGCRIIGGGPEDSSGYYLSWPTYMADLPNIYSRIFEWLSFEYNIQGELYFDTVHNYARNNDDLQECPLGEDPWKTLFCFGGNGDGTLFYPGITELRSGVPTSVVVGGQNDIPIESIRLKMIRDGMEDYEYLKQVETKNGKSWIVTNIYPYIKAIDPYDPPTPPPQPKFITYVWNKDPGTATSPTGLVRAREELANALDPPPPQGNQPPVARISGTPTSGAAAPLIVSFSGVSSSDPDGSITLYEWDFGDGHSASGPTVSAPTNTYAAPGIFTATLTITDNLGAKGSAQMNILVGNCPSTGDCFNGAAGAGLSAAWNVYVPAFERISNQVRNVDTSSNEAQFLTNIGPNQEVSVLCKVSAAGSGSGNNCGVMARWSDANNFYYAHLDVGLQKIYLFKKVAGIVTKLGEADETLSLDNYYKLRLVVNGSALSLYFENEFLPSISATDTSLGSGNYAGIRSYNDAAFASWFDDFSAKAATVPCSKSDCFDRPDGPNLGLNWNEYLPGFNISAAQARNNNAGANEARYNLAVGPDQDVSATCSVVATGNNCGVMGRWTDANNYYYAFMDVGLGKIYLYKRVGGVATKLGEAVKTLAYSAYFNLRLVIQGSALNLYFNNEALASITATDTSLATGDFAGIRSYGSAASNTWYRDFNLVTSTCAATDCFNRANNTNLGPNWNEYVVDFEIFSNELRNVDTQSNEAQFTLLLTADQDVSADCQMTDGGNNCGVMARWTDPNNYYYAFLDAGLGKVFLYKKVGGTSTKIGEAPEALSFSAYYHIRLIVQGGVLGVYVNNETTPSISAVDSTLATGNYAGIRSFSSAAASTGFENFKASKR